ncbi:hypothetical protein EDB84DRAFT_1600084, partial [Lactarius hengduanensis]
CRPRRRGRLNKSEEEAAWRAQLAAGGSDTRITTRTRCSTSARRRDSRRSASSSPISTTPRSSSVPALSGASPLFRSRHFVLSHMRTGSSADADLDNILKSSPNSKEDIVVLSEAIIAHIVKHHQDKPLYSTFVEHHVRALAMPPRDCRDQEKTNGKKTPKAAAKPVLGASKVGNKLDTMVYDKALNDFWSNTDDFM